MSEANPELEAFSKFVDALAPWLGEVVLIGGWAHRLYRIHPLARKLDYLPLTTLDGDVAVPPRLKAQEATVRQQLLDAGFEEEFVGEDQPPSTHYHYGKGGGFYAEFLTPLVGSEYDRRGRRKATKEVGGISSQLLRYIEILMLSPWKVELDKENGYPFSAKRNVRIANPASFLVQKILIHGERNLQGPGQGPPLYTRHDRGLFRESGRIANDLSKRRRSTTPSTKKSGNRRRCQEALRQSRRCDSGGCAHGCRTKGESGETCGNLASGTERNLPFLAHFLGA